MEAYDAGVYISYHITHYVYTLYAGASATMPDMAEQQAQQAAMLQQVSGVLAAQASGQAEGSPQQAIWL